MRASGVEATLPVAGAASEQVVPALSPRQYEVLRLLALGRTYDEAAHDLGIARNTVKRTVTEALERCEVGRAVDAFRAVGWLSVP